MVKALQAEGCAAGRWEGEQEEERHNTLQPEKRKGFRIKDYVTFDMSYISRSSTRELTLCHAMLAVLTLGSYCLMTFPSCQRFSHFMSTTSLWGSSLDNARCAAPRWSCTLHVRVAGQWQGTPLLISYFSSLQKEGGLRMSPSPYCRPAPIRTWSAFSCTSGIGILLVWEAKSFGTVTRPNPSLLALRPLIAFPHFTWD